MRIESGPTGERRTRILLFLAMCTGFAGWFAYDGLWGYPGKNLEWARTNLRHAPDDLRTHPRATMGNLRRVTEGMSAEQLVALLGEPALVEEKTHTYVGRELAVTVRFDEHDQVIAVGTEPAPGDQPPDKINLSVTAQRVERIQPGIAAAQLGLGTPATSRERTLWFVGPATYGRFEIVAGAVRGFNAPGSRIAVGEAHENTEKSESDIFLQKVLAVLLAGVALFTAFKCFRVIRTRVVLDDAGLTYNGKKIPWEAMTGLVTDEYPDKGWVDLEYRTHGATDRQRLDWYHFQEFDAILTEICERKGFRSPLKKPAASGFDVVGEQAPADPPERED